MNRVWLIVFVIVCAQVSRADDVPHVALAPTIDGDPTDAAWASADWRSIDAIIIGGDVHADDFSGRYKLVWNEQRLYLLAEIQDDVLIDTHADPMTQYWDDDALEIFLDADASGGDHLHNYNAFAYHVALDNQAIDIGPFRSDDDRRRENRYVRAFPDHITSRWQRSSDAPFVVYWEVSIAVFDDDFDDFENASTQLPAVLANGRSLGFMLAYCDADDASGRQHFVGDVAIEPVNGDRNRGYYDADVFRRITLKK